MLGASLSDGMRLRLYHYWRSSSSWRVRWAFALKGITYEAVTVNLLAEDPESPDHLARNPLGYVPVLEFLDSPDHGFRRFLSESTAIVEWAEETHPQPPLLPSLEHPIDRGHARQLAQIINAGTQPLQNQGVNTAHSSDPAEQKRWNQLWIRKGLRAYENLAAHTAGRFSIGDRLTLADIFLVPQCYNAGRNEVSLDEFPTIARIAENALATEAARASHPDAYKPAN